MELVRILPDLAVTLYQAVPHGHHGLPAAALTSGQMRAVVHLAHHGRMTMGEFAGGLSISRAAATEVIARLAEKGFVRREHDDADRRIVFVSLAGHAEGYADSMLAEWREHVEGTLTSFPEIDPATLVAFLRALVLRWKTAAKA
jgi:DNA-binding MarR family transcriptional regulator